MERPIRDAFEIPETAPIVDADLAVPPNDELAEYLPDRYERKGVAYPDGNWPSPFDATTPTDPHQQITDYLDRLDIDAAIVSGGGPNMRASVQPDTRYAAELVSAYNDWLLEHWISTDDRLRGSISVTMLEPSAAAAEIRRLGDRTDMVQVIAGGATRVGLGDQRYWPIYEAAAEMALPIAFRAGTEGYGVAHPNTGAGYPNSAIERHAVAPANFMGQLLNLVLEGPFIEYPQLRVSIVGAGYGWFPSFLWRVDKMWKGLTDDYPWVEELPSEYLRRHVRIVTWPLNEGPNTDRTTQLLDMLNAEETLMFGSGYPRVDGYDPDTGLPEIPERYADSVFSATPASFYGINR